MNIFGTTQHLGSGLWPTHPPCYPPKSGVLVLSFHETIASKQLSHTNLFNVFLDTYIRCTVCHRMQCAFNAFNVHAELSREATSMHGFI